MIEPTNLPAERAVAALELDDVLEDLLPDVARVLDRAAEMIEQRYFGWDYEWAAHDAIGRAWAEIARHEPDVERLAIDWLLRVAIDVARSRYWSDLIGLMRDAAQYVRDEIEEAS